MRDVRPKPTVIIPDTSPLVHLAAADALAVLNGFGRVVVVDVVVLEATTDLDKPYAREIAAWIEVATTRNLLDLAQDLGIVPSAAAVWSRIAAAVPTANPVSVITTIDPARP